MSTWNHRVVRHKGEGQEPDWYAIHEVYYNDVGNITGITANKVAPFGESKSEINSELTNMLAACNKKIIDFDTSEESIGHSKWYDVKNKEK